MVSITSPTQITTSAQIAPGTILGSDIAGNAAIHFTQMEAVTAGKLIMGNASNEAAQLAMSGDATISSAGAVAIASNVIVNDDVNTSAAIALSKLAALPSAQIIVGSAGNVPTAVAMSGDVSIANTGATAISGLALSKLAALPSTQIIIGNSSNVAAAAAMSGDVTIGNTGITAIGSSKVTEAMQVIADNTTNNVSTSYHGYAPKVTDTAKFLKGDGTWATPAGAGLTDIKFIGRATVTGSAASTVDFSSITAGFKGYLITCHMTTTSSVNWILLRVNNVTGSSYTMNSMETNGTVVTAQNQTLTGLCLTENTAGEWAGIFAHVAQGNNAQAVRSASMANADAYKGCWYAEADALSADINQLTFYPNGNTFVVGSYFEIFGYS